jgi:cytochrome c peroxidase
VFTQIRELDSDHREFPRPTAHHSSQERAGDIYTRFTKYRVRVRTAFTWPCQVSWRVMKRSSCSPARLTALVAAGFIIGTASSIAQLPEKSSLAIAAVGNVGRVTVTDPGNHAWTLQSSTDLTSWTDVETFKVHNGGFYRGFSPDPATPRRYFRAFYNPAAQTLTSTTANALLLPGTPFNYANPTLPPRFLVQPILGQDNTPDNNPVTDPAATLGRVLFYDKRLSRNQTISCSSCHQREHGFSDPKRFSVGFEGGLTGRNSMGLSNARWYQRRAFFWDERAATLEDQVLQPIQNAVEMGMTLPDLVNRLSTEPFYATLFNNAFGTPTVTSNRISRALAQFVRSIISTQSKFDAGVPVGFANFTPEENLGRQIFNGQVRNATCTACHGTDNFVPGPNINNNGLENPYIDKGVGALTGLAADEGLFKVPSLRNIALTAPYMHDGRFATLEQVVEFYNSGVVNHPNLSPPLRNPPPGNGPRRLNLTNAEKAALVAFLNTLTDTSVTTHEKFSDPFNYGSDVAPAAPITPLTSISRTGTRKTSSRPAKARLGF